MSFLDIGIYMYYCECHLSADGIPNLLATVVSFFSHISYDKLINYQDPYDESIYEPRHR